MLIAQHTIYDLDNDQDGGLLKLEIHVNDRWSFKSQRDKEL